VDTLLLALRVLVSLGVVIGAIWFLQRRMSKGGSKAKRAGKPMSVVARQNLGPKASVAVVEFGGKQFLLGVTEHGISVLDDAGVTEPVAVEATEPERRAVSQPTLVTAAATMPPAVTRRASSKQNSQDFAQALGKATAPEAAAVRAKTAPLPAPSHVRLAQRDTFGTDFTSSKLAGSILSASTWKQAWTAVRGGR
jgi:flagellar protein FliO/FliZ